MKLDDGEREVTGLVIEGRSVVDRSRLVESVPMGEGAKGQGEGVKDEAVFVGGSLVVDGDAFEVDHDGNKK